MGGKEESMRNPHQIGEAEEEPGQLKVRTPAEKNMEMVIKHRLLVSLSPQRLMHVKRGVSVFGSQTTCDL